MRERYPRSRLWSVWSAVIALICLLVSVFYIVPYIVPQYGTGPLIWFLVGCLSTFLMTLSFRFVPFQRARGELARKGQVGRKTTSRKAEALRAFWLNLITCAAAIAPILLLAILPPAEWLSVVIGAFLGLSCGELLFLAIVRVWERSVGLEVYRYRVYSVVAGRRVLLEYGLTAQRRQK